MGLISSRLLGGVIVLINVHEVAMINETFFLSMFVAFRPIIIGLIVYATSLLICRSFRLITGNNSLSSFENWFSSRKGLGAICVLSGAWLLNFTLYYQHFLIILLSVVLLVISFLIANSL